MKTSIDSENTALRDQQMAKQIASLLNERASNLDAKTASKLSYARQLALANMARPSSAMAINQHGVLRLFGHYWHQHRLLITLLLLGVGLAGMLTMQHIVNQEASEQGDAYLLASDLPPEVYLNEGFGTWLSENTQQ